MTFLTSSKADEKRTNNTEKQRTHSSPQTRFKQCDETISSIRLKHCADIYKFTCTTHLSKVVELELCYV